MDKRAVSSKAKADRDRRGDKASKFKDNMKGGRVD